MNSTAEKGILLDSKIQMIQRVKARLSSTALDNGPSRPDGQTFMSFVLDNANTMDDETANDFRALMED
ncbi:MAG: hypothetical protein FWE27_04885 [Defluviitaleaceae bacterium]|nr:hypothetical protein [Defluviitaleaceae bacterium]